VAGIYSGRERDGAIPVARHSPQARRDYAYDVEHKQIVKYAEERIFTQIHLHDGHKFELTLYPEDKVHYVFKRSITGKAIERASTAELEGILRAEHPDMDLESEVERIEDQLDPYLLFRMLLEPLEGVKQSPEYHPEGDALYQSLQVFELAREERPYDEEFLLAAFLHDVGKAINPSDHVLAALQSLEGAITARTEWLIAHHMEVQALRAGILGVKARARIQSSEYYDDLILLAELDRHGRVRGASVCELDEALEFLRDLAGQGLEP
jgi:hypothetical protein